VINIQLHKANRCEQDEDRKKRILLRVDTQGLTVTDAKTAQLERLVTWEHVITISTAIIWLAAAYFCRLEDSALRAAMTSFLLNIVTFRKETTI